MDCEDRESDARRRGMGRGRRDKGGGELCGRKRAGDYGREASKGNANEKKGEEENDKEKKKMGASQTVVTHTFKSCCLSLEMTAMFFIVSTWSCLSSDLIEDN